MARLCMHGLILFTCLVVATSSCKGSTVCAPCGKYPVPYPLSTSSSCGHPLYPLTCTPEKKQLEVQALSGSYTVQSLDPLTRSMVVSTGAFLGNSCITQDSVSAGNFSLFPDAPFFISPGNTLLFLNGSDAIKYAPFNCSTTSPCHNALRSLPQKSCRSSLCCSFVTDGQFFKYAFPVRGLAMAYVSIVDLVDSNTSDASRWTYGLRLSWEVPREPPCAAHARCGGNSTCGLAPPIARSPSLPSFGASDTKAYPLRLCLCNKGFRWDPITGSCPIEPYCVRNSRSVECHKAQYASGLTIGIVGLIAITALTLYTCKRQRAAQRAHAKLVKERNMILAASSEGKSARLYSSKEMKHATNNFSRDRLLGCGAFGEVYKGILDDKSVVAIKSAKIGNIKGIDQVLNEVRVLSQVNHRSLVRLLGCCVESELPLLVYEYVPNGNLYDHLASIYNVLDWKTRLQIGLQSAEGLSYLHSAAYPPIYHRDVKSSNILLDKSMNAKVSDFGLSRLAEPDVTHVTTCVQGTMGYLDPEYYRNYQLTDKSDVYSFGVVLLELVTSQKAIDFRRSEDNVSLVNLVQISKEESRLDDVIDLDLVKGAPKETVNSMRFVVDLALECLHESRLNRPSMKDVVVSLQQIICYLEAADHT